jgi:hypothetical protein
MKVIQFRQMEGGVYRILQACKLLKIKRSVFMRNMREERIIERIIYYLLYQRYRDSFDYIFRLTTININ